MNPIKERTAKRTLFLGSALLIGLMGMMGMPQMIGSANAQSEQGSEHACKELPGGTLERGRCTAPAESEFVCDPSSVRDVTATLTGETCKTPITRVSGDEAAKFKKECEDIVVDGEKGVATVTNVPRSGDKDVTCTFPATEEFTCPNDIEPINGQCITKPGDRTEEEA